MSFVVLDIETVPDRDRWSPPTETPDAFPPTWAHKIVCVGFLSLDDDMFPTKSGTLVGEERDVLEKLSKSMDKHPTVISFNGRSFDLPVIMQRSLLHRVAQRWYYAQNDYRYRFSARLHVDLCDQLSDHGAAKMSTLDAFAKLIGLPGKGDVNGAIVDQLVAAGKLELVRTYCLDDVRQTALLFLRTWFLRGNLRPEELDERWAAVEKHFAPAAQTAVAS